MRGAALCLPLGAALRLGRFLGGSAYHLDAKHRAVAGKNIARALGLPEEGPETRTLVRSVFRNTGQVAAEFVRLPRELENTDLIELHGWEKVEHALSLGRGLIFITGHTGNWELMGAYVSACHGPLSCVARPFRNRYLERYIRKQREAHGQRILTKQGALLKSARVLKQGGIVAFLVDQYPGSHEPKLDFMGTPAHTHTAPQALAVRFQAPLVAGFCHRVGKGFRYRGYFEDPVLPDPGNDPEAEVLRLAQYANDAIARYVTDYPDQWLWMHRRWR